MKWGFTSRTLSISDLLTVFNMRVCYCNSIYRKKIQKGIIGPLTWFTANKVKGIIIKCGEALLTV